MSVLLWNAHIHAAGRFEQLRANYRLRAHDLIVFAETLAPACSALARRKLQLSGYHHFAASWKSVAGGRRSGGVSVFVRDSLRDRVQELARTDEPGGCESLWLRVHHALPGGRSLLVGACYCAPLTSSVYNRADGSGASSGELPDLVFGALSGQLDLLREDDDEVLLLGDFNAHVGQLDERGDSVRTSVDAPAPLRQLRSSSDAKVDAFGRALAGLCQAHDLSIINGRAVGDSPAACTCFNTRQGSSVIDLYIASVALFTHVRRLEVKPSHKWGASNVLSDHLPVALELGLDWLTPAPVGPPVGGARRRGPGKLPLFDVRRKGAWESLFADPDGEVAAALRALSGELHTGASCDQGVEGVKGILGGCLRKAGGARERGPGGRTPSGGMTSSPAPGRP